MPAPDAEPAPAAPGQLTLVDVRRLWPGVLDRVKKSRRYAWILLSQNAHVKDVGDKVITIGLVNAGARDSFTRSGADEILHQALIDELGVDWRVESIIDTRRRGRRHPRRTPGRGRAGRSHRRHHPPEDDAARSPLRRRGPLSVEAAKAAVRPTRKKGEGDADDEEADTSHTEVAEDDDVIDDASLSGQELLARELGRSSHRRDRARRPSAPGGASRRCRSLASKGGMASLLRLAMHPPGHATTTRGVRRSLAAF